MDKKTQNLDPQLKAAYDRVMGTSVPPPAPSRDAPEPVAAAQPTQSPQVVTSTPAPADSGATKVVAGGSKRGRISPILVGVAIVLFFLIYTFVWTMVFKLKVPFLPS